MDRNSFLIVIHVKNIFFLKKIDKQLSDMKLILNFLKNIVIKMDFLSSQNYYC